VTVLSTIVEPLSHLAAIFDAQLFQRGWIGFEPIGHDLDRASVTFQGLLQKHQGRSLIALLREVTFEDLTQMPAPLGVTLHSPDALLPNVSREHRSEPVPAEPNRLVAQVVTALEEQVLDVSKRQRIPHVKHHDHADDFGR